MGVGVGAGVGWGVAVGVGAGVWPMLSEAVAVGLADAVLSAVAVVDAVGDGVILICSPLGVVPGVMPGAAVCPCWFAGGDCPPSGVFNPGGTNNVHPANVTVVNELTKRMFILLSHVVCYAARTSLSS